MAPCRENVVPPVLSPALGRQRRSVAHSGRAVRAGGGELPPVRAERHRVHTVGLAGEDAVQCGYPSRRADPGGARVRADHM